MAKKTVAAKKRNVKVDANDSCMFILHSTTSLYLWQIVKVRLSHGLLQVRWDLEVLRRTLLMQHRWLHKIALK